MSLYVCLSLLLSVFASLCLFLFKYSLSDYSFFRVPQYSNHFDISLYCFQSSTYRRKKKLKRSDLFSSTDERLNVDTKNDEKSVDNRHSRQKQL